MNRAFQQLVKHPVKKVNMESIGHPKYPSKKRHCLMTNTNPFGNTLTLKKHID